MSVSDRRRLTASARVLTAMTGVLGVAVALLLAAGYLVTVGTLEAAVDDSLRREAAAYRAAVRSAPASDALTVATRSYLSGRPGGSSGVDAVLLAAFENGRVISNSDLRLERVPGNTAVSDPPSSPTFDDVQLDGVRFRVLSVPIVASGRQVGVFQAAVSREQSILLARRVALTLGGAAIIGFALGLPLAYWATRRSLDPLRRMAADAHGVSHAEPGRRIAYAGPADELGTLAASLNAMLDRLEHAFADQRSFIADASHELRTPVAVIRGNAELIRSGAASGSDATESLEQIEAEAIRMSRLLDDLLALARLEDTGRRHFQPLEVSVMLVEAAARARSLANRDIEAERGCEVWVDGDPDLLDRALANLTRNAVAHTDDGGRIELGCARKDDVVELTVTDDGPGIPERDLERIFDRFYRPQGPRPSGDASGAGLGLAITRRLIELHGGSITAENVAPHGARFTIRLPCIEPPADA